MVLIGMREGRCVMAIRLSRCEGNIYMHQEGKRKDEMKVRDLGINSYKMSHKRIVLNSYYLVSFEVNVE